MTDVPVAIIGGSGLYEFIDDAESVTVPTPYGPHSEGLVRGQVSGRDTAFLPRHGLGHRYPPHGINYRANLWAMASLGVRQVLAPCAVGSLQPELQPGSFVVPHQLVDRTHRRDSSFIETGEFHVSFADPYCSAGRAVLVEAAARTQVPLTPQGVMVVIEGPRFSTRAESQSFSQQGWSLVNMTGMPEAVLARELAMCYSALAVVTDYDAGVDASAAVHQDDVFAVFERSLGSLRDVLTQAVALLPRNRTCDCAAALNGLSTAHLPRAHENPNPDVPVT